MKRILLTFFFTSFFLISCYKSKEKPVAIPSTGRINALTIIINDQLWNGEVGDSLRKKFASPVDGLPQEEPLFTINQYPSKAIDANKIYSRNLVIVTKDDKNRFRIDVDEFAKPQNVVHLAGNSNEEIIQKLEQNFDVIIKKFKQTEILENQKLINLSLLSDKKIRRKFKVSLKLPSTYKTALNRPNFIWIKREILSGNNNILIYKVPFKSILKDDNISNNIIKIRDSIGALYIHTRVKNSKMITEESYSPYFLKTILNGKRTFETKGTWELKGDYMSGSFINYAIMDRSKRKFIIIEGFCYAPSTDKRDLMFELEAIIKSIKILK
jgi:hypothetical protein